MIPCSLEFPLVWTSVGKQCLGIQCIWSKYKYHRSIIVDFKGSGLEKYMWAFGFCNPKHLHLIKLNTTAHLLRPKIWTLKGSNTLLSQCESQLVNHWWLIPLKCINLVIKHWFVCLNISTQQRNGVSLGAGPSVDRPMADVVSVLIFTLLFFVFKNVPLLPSVNYSIGRRSKETKSNGAN